MTDTHDTTPPGQWKAGAKAHAAFQNKHFGVAKGGKVDGGPRKGSHYATLPDILEIANKGSEFGLSHSGEPRVLGSDMLVWRHYLHHESGEMIYAEWPIAIPTSGQAGQRQQELGSGATYARKCCIQALYGIHGDDNTDPDLNSYEDAKPAKVERLSQTPTPKPVTVAEPQPVVISDAGLNEEEKALCLTIVKDPDKGPAIKQQFMAKFYPSAEKLFPNMITSKEHMAYLDELHHASVPF